ncbi:MAG: efflux RND transporter permease subunit [Synechococcales cyanobacterium RM1_1_8]|nr:efflux RND transporter permease subunit [Synechococcales cyanobacterium RM1_1_8]
MAAGGDRPEISINTLYLGAGPSEVEDLITRPIEEVMESVEGVREITSTSAPGGSSINLEFEWGTDPDERLLDVINKLQRVRNLPAEASDPDVSVASTSSQPMIWLVMVPQEGRIANANEYRDLVNDILEPELRRVRGVSSFIIAGGQEREVEVRIDSQALADREVTINQVTNAIRQTNRDIRGGPLVVGRREYRVSTVSRADQISDLENIVLRRNQLGTVFLRDVAQISLGRKVKDSVLLFNSQESVAIGIIRQVGANVPEVSQGVRDTVARVSQTFNALDAGVDFVTAYDESDYIDQSVALMRGNLLTGALLAVVVLLLFLGSPRSVAVIALTIPTAMVSVFLVMTALGRSLNIISLAGLGFAVGMIVDNAIVVLENVFSHLQQGKRPIQAAIDGTSEVATAMLGSTMTTVAVFAPIVLVQGEAGQLFADVAITLASAVLFSLFAALTLVPMLCGLFLNQREVQLLEQGASAGRNGFERAIARASTVFQAIQGRLEQFLLHTASWSIGVGKMGRRLLVLAIPIALLVVGIVLLPPADYLPQGNRNLILWLAQTLPGTSVEEAIALSEAPRAYVQSLEEVQGVFFVNSSQFKAMGVFLKPEYANGKGLEQTVGKLIPASFGFPGYRFMFPIRISIFQDPGKEFEVRMTGPDLKALAELEQKITPQLQALGGVVNVRSDYVAGAPQLEVRPTQARLSELGLSTLDAGALVEAALGGSLASDFVEGTEELDVTVKLKGSQVETPNDLRQLPLYSPSGARVQLGDVASIEETTGPDVINRVNLERAITLTVSLAPDAPLSTLVEQAQTQVLDPLQAQLPPGERLELSGSADKLSETLGQLGETFVFSLLIIYLLLVALYRSFLYPVVIMMTVPIGLTGAVLSIVLANLIPGVSAPLDMITGLGFVILVGVVVNNAILLVDRALQLQQDEGMDYHHSLFEATRDRLRPIFMSAGTSVLGMLPLAVIPGEGAELYQGLGIALTGGLAFSTLLTPTVVPALMGLLYDLRGKHLVALSGDDVVQPEKVKV